MAPPMDPRSILESRGVALFAAVGLAALALSVDPRAAPPQTGGQTGGGGGPSTPQAPPPQVRATAPAYGTADSNGTMIAVTGVDLTGSSILYLVDTSTRHLAVYQAQGGAESTQGLKLVGARRIDLDLQLDGYNDKSEYSVQELERKFAEIGRTQRKN